MFAGLRSGEIKDIVSGFFIMLENPVRVGDVAEVAVALLMHLCAFSVAPGTALAERFGAEPRQPVQTDSSLSIELGNRWRSRLPPEPTLSGRESERWGSRLWSKPPDGADTIERVSGEEKGPRVPEPMVFDLVRPLGEKRGAGEVNVLGVVPLRRTSKTVDDVPDPLGLVRRSQDTQGVEWAPEIEYAVADGLALEFELPMENVSVEAYKAAGQATFGTLWNYRFIHGAQVIAQYDRNPGLWTTTWLYLAGYRFDQTWSLFGMFGPRFEHGGQIGAHNAEMLANLTLFADVTDRLVMGLETNFGQVLDGSSALLVMPQVHYEVGYHWMVQSGAGFRATDNLVIPQLAFRLIREF